MTPKDIYKQINQLTDDLIKSGLCLDQNKAVLKSKGKQIDEIGIPSREGMSFFLKSSPYADIYAIANKKRIYNVKMIDGSLLSLHYRFEREEIIAHRLLYLPSPDLNAFQYDSQGYLGDEIYNDIVDESVLQVPIRFDFDSNPNVYKEVEHPISHLTLGQYPNCRIPVSSALTPYQFISFIVFNFYQTDDKHVSLRKYDEKFEDCISNTEKKMIHICTPR